MSFMVRNNSQYKLNLVQLTGNTFGVSCPQIFLQDSCGTEPTGEGGTGLTI